MLQNMCKMTHLVFRDASMLVSVGIFLMHWFETVDVFAHFLCVKKAKCPLSGALPEYSLQPLNDYHFNSFEKNLR